MGRSSFSSALLLFVSVALLSCRSTLAGDNDKYCRVVNITGYEQYYIPSVENGDATGKKFVFGRDEMLQSGVAVSKISAWTGDRYLTGIEITLSNGSARTFGHKNGDSSSYSFKGDETLTYWYQWKSTDGAHKVAGIEFKTSNGGHFKKKASDTSYGCNMGCPDCLLESIGSGILAGFQGYDCDSGGGGDICRLTPIIVRTITSQEMTNMTYPDLDEAPPPVSDVLYDYPVFNNASTSSTTKFTHSITEKQSLTWSLATSFKFTFMQNVKVSVSGGAPGVAGASTESTTQYTWEVSQTFTIGMTYETTETYTEEFTFVCAPYTSCRFVVSQGDGDLSDNYNDFTALYTVYLDSGASMLYSVSGQVAADQLSPYSQVVVSEPIVNSAAVASAVVPVDHDPEDPGDGQGLPQAPPAPQRGPGLPALLMYARCPRVNNAQLCTRRQRAPPAVVRGLGKRLMMSERAITRVQDRLPFRSGHIVIDYAAPFDYSRRPPRLRIPPQTSG